MALQLAEGTTLSDTLRYLRSCGIAAPLSCRVARGSSHADAVSVINTLADELICSRANGTGIRIEPEECTITRDRTATRDDDDDSDSDSEEEGEFTVWIGSTGWLDRCVSFALRCAQSGDVCVRHDTGNGRIGMLLRRCPSLEVLLEQSVGGMTFSAWLKGTPPPQEHLAPMPTRLHLGDAKGSELEAPSRPERTGWELPLLWQLNKIYCCPYSDGECSELQLPNRPAVRCYPLDDDDFDAWAKVEWDETDADDVAATGKPIVTQIQRQPGCIFMRASWQSIRNCTRSRLPTFWLRLARNSPRRDSSSSGERLPAAASPVSRRHAAAVCAAAPRALLWSTRRQRCPCTRRCGGSRACCAGRASNGRA